MICQDTQLQAQDVFKISLWNCQLWQCGECVCHFNSGHHLKRDKIKINHPTQERIVSLEKEKIKYCLYANFIKIVLKINEISAVEIVTILTHFQCKLGSFGISAINENVCGVCVSEKSNLIECEQSWCFLFQKC